MFEMNRSLEQLVNVLEVLAPLRGSMTLCQFVEKKCAIYQDFTESQMPYLDDMDEELAYYIEQLRADSMILRGKCVKFLRNSSTSEIDTDVEDEDKELSALLENIFLKVMPAMVARFDAAAA